jgi:hypothetical protein
MYRSQFYKSFYLSNDLHFSTSYLYHSDTVVNKVTWMLATRLDFVLLFCWLELWNIVTERQENLCQVVCRQTSDIWDFDILYEIVDTIYRTYGHCSSCIRCLFWLQTLCDPLQVRKRRKP